MKKFVRIALLVAAWAAVTWLYRDKLLPLPRADGEPVPHFRTGPPPDQVADRPTPAVTAETHPADDLTEIIGIGPVYQGRLTDVGITSFADLAAADPPTIAEAIEVAPSMVEGWVEQARGMAN